jgi:hypothetical protein
MFFLYSEIWEELDELNEGYIFVPIDSDQKQGKLAKSTDSHEELQESDYNGSGYQKSGPHDGGSDGWDNFSQRGRCFLWRKPYAIYRVK